MLSILFSCDNYEMSVKSRSKLIPSTSWKSVNPSPGDKIEASIFFYPLSKDQIFDVTELKAFADDKLNVTKMTISL